MSTGLIYKVLLKVINSTKVLSNSYENKEKRRKRDNELQATLFFSSVS